MKAIYAEQIAAFVSQIVAVVARQTMKDNSGASVMGPKTQVTPVHGHTVLDLALQPLEANFSLPLVHEIADTNDRAMLDVAVVAAVNMVGDPILIAADAAREADNSPDSVMAAAAAIVGARRVERALACTDMAVIPAIGIRQISADFEPKNFRRGEVAAVK